MNNQPNSWLSYITTGIIQYKWGIMNYYTLNVCKICNKIEIINQKLVCEKCKGIVKCIKSKL